MARKQQRPHIKIDQSITSHQRTIKIAAKYFYASIGLHVAAIGWCDRLRTNGHLPADIVPTLGKGGYKAAQSELLRVGMWECTDDGFLIHDYLDWQDSAEDINRRSQRGRENAGRRWQTEEAEASCNASGIATGNADETRRDEPIKKERERDALASDGKSFEECWDAYPVHKFKERSKQAYTTAVRAGIDTSRLFAACAKVPRTATQSLCYFIADGTWCDFAPRETRAKYVCGTCHGDRFVFVGENAASPCPECNPNGGAR
ncbi:MAG: hypothetical protein PF636_08875 [Actinomycetota bacterium]|jgi:hypothetical protein|nr:hypothetical protein [Actinomycetota bacterium]